MGARSSQSRGPGLNKSDGHLLEYFRQTFGAGGGGTNAPSGAGSGLTASGGVISDYTDGPAVYRAHIFTSSGTFDVTALGDFGDTVDYLVVAGAGGGGGGYYGGGGGAGGVRTNLSGHPLSTGNPSFTVATDGGNGSGSYTVTIGGGGVGGYYPGGSNSNNGNDGGQGVDSYFGPPSTPAGITAKGGGRGLGRATSVSSPRAGYPGGSGGGIGYNGPDLGYGYNPSTPAPIVPNIPSPHPYGITQGYPGGPAPNNTTYGSSGGGAGGPGAVGGGPLAHGADGGAGAQILIAGPPTTSGVGSPGPGGGFQWFAGGGAGGGGGTNHPDRYGGGADPSGNNTGTGPFAGGGNGGDDQDSRAATSGLSGTGGGGGGGCATTNIGNGGHGGSGVVVVRYQIGELTADAKATGGAISYYGGKTIHTFTNSGTFATTSDWSPTNVEYVVVGGGGAGNGGPGPSAGGGGGAGGFITADNHPIGTHPVSVTVTIGAGAASAANTRTGGTPSSFGSPITAYGGGGGGRHINGGGNPVENGLPGGSGGGESDSQGPIGAGVGSKQTGTTTDAPITPQGNPGGAGAGNGGTNSVSGGGGGGAGQVGQDAVDQGRGGHGGYGRQLPATFQNPVSATSLGTSPDPNKYNGPNSGNFWFAGGGGGAASNSPHSLSALAGLGGGGQGYQNPGSSLPGPRDVMDAIQNTGGGGGAFHGPAGGTTAGSGGSGIVLIAYPS
jgi:hypothetical protein